MLEAARRKPPDSVTVLAFSDRFGKRPRLLQLPLFPELVRPVCWGPRTPRERNKS